MNHFVQFDISDFLNEIQEPLFLFDNEEIIYFNSYFKNYFKLIPEDWKQFFVQQDLQAELNDFFSEGSIPKGRLIKALENQNGYSEPFEWSFTNLPSSYSSRFLIAKGNRIRLLEQDVKGEVFRPGGALSEELKYIQSILSNGHDLIVILDATGNYRFASESISNKLGISPSDLIGRNYLDLINAGIIELVKGSLKDIHLTREEIAIDFWVNLPSGRRLYLESFAKNLLDHPQIQGILVNSRDITDFILTERQLQKRYEIENLINQVSASLVPDDLIDLEGRFDQSLQLVGHYLGAFYAKILILNHDTNQLELIHTWVGEGSHDAESVMMTSRYFSVFNQSKKILEYGKIKLATFSKNNGKNSSSDQIGLLLIPMISSENLLGIIQFEFYPDRFAYAEKDLQLLKQFGDILAGAYLGSQITRKLKRNEDLLTYTEMLSRSGSWRYSAFKELFYFSAGLSKLFGLGNQPLVQDFSSLIYLIDKPCRAEFIQNLKIASQQLTQTSGEFTLKSESGDIRYISYEIEGKKEFLSEGIEVFGFCTDVTHKRAADSYLRLQAQILAQVGDPILVINNSLEIIYLNVKAEELFLHTHQKSPIGTAIETVLEIKWKNNESFKQITNQLQHGEIWKSERFVRKRQTDLVPFELTCQAILSENQEKIGYSLILHDLEEKYRSEKEAKLAQLIVENSQMVLFRVNPSSNFAIEYISDNISRYGYNAKELIQQKVSFLDLIHPEDAQRIRESLTQSKTSEGVRSFSGEYRIITGEGKSIWVEDRTTDVLNESGQIIKHEGLFQDISDRKNLEFIQKQRDEQYRMLASNIPDTNIFLLDSNRTYIVAEGNNFEKWGYTREDFEGKNLKEVQLSPYPEISQILDSVFEEKKIVESEFFLKNRYYQRTIRPILQEEEVKYALSIIRDITEEYQAKQDLLQSEEKYRRLVEDSTEIIFSLTETFILNFVSPNVKQFLDYEAEEVIGRSIFDFLNPDDLDVFRGMLDENVDFLSQNQYLEFRLRHKNGTYRVFSSNGRLTVGKNGIHRFYTGIARDISKLKEAQRELLLAKEKAEQASQVKSQFLSIMSHEIRTPMNAVIGLAHFLMEENPRPDQLENLKTLQFSAENLMALINDILDFNKIESGKVELEKVQFDLKTMINRIVHAHSFHANDKGLKLITEVDASIPEMLIGDSLRLGQIVNNLISNAVKFTEKGHVKISLSRELTHHNQTEIRFMFEDSGIGIPENKQKSIFEAFTQASSSTTRKYGGTGLGLAIVKKLVELHGGDIELRSRRGGGSVFEFTIPFEFVQEKEGLTQTKESSLPKSLEFASILVAEDNTVNQILIRKFLSKWNTGKIEIASDGLEAYEKYIEGNYNLVLLDLQMPELDGFEVAKKIRELADPEKCNVPILALTAASYNEVRQELFDAGINDFIPKPFSPEILFEKIVRFLTPQIPS